MMAQSAPAGSKPQYHQWWHDQAPGLKGFTAGNKNLPLSSVRGNKFVNPEGKAVLFRGLAISDPDKLEKQGHWNRTHFVKAREMGTMLLRIPIHPVAWRERTPTEYLKLLDQAVGWCTKLGMYIMLDWHTIGNLETGLYQDPMYETTKQETCHFWRIMARHYADTTQWSFMSFSTNPPLTGTSSAQLLGTPGRQAWRNRSF